MKNNESEEQRKTKAGFFKVGENKRRSYGRALGLNEETELGARDVSEAKRKDFPDRSPG